MDDAGNDQLCHWQEWMDSGVIRVIRIESKKD